MSYHGDIALGNTIDIKFTTRQSTGAPTTLAGSPVISAYVGNGTTEITAGITLSVDFDSRTGLNNVRVVATGGNGFATATDVELVITTGTVNSVSVVGEVIGSFSIENRSPLRPATAGRTVVVDTAGLIDANVVKAGPTGSGVAWNANTTTHLNQIYDTDYATIYDTTNKAFLAKLGNFAMGGSSLVVTYASSQDFTTTQKTSITSAVPTTVQIATGVWTDTTAGDFTAALSIGKSIMNGVTLGTGLTINGYTGNTVQTGDSYARIGAAGVSLSAIPDLAGVTTLLSRIGGSITISGGKVAATMGSSDYTGNTVQTGDAYARLGAPAGASHAADVAAVKTDTGNLVTRITLALFSGITSLASWLGALAGKTADASTQTEIRATTAGATYTITTDSLEALRDRGDAAWGAGSVPSVADIVTGVFTTASTVETGVNLQAALRRIGAGVGNLSGAGTGTEILVGLDGVTVRITATVDSLGNRTNVFS